MSETAAPADVEPPPAAPRQGRPSLTRSLAGTDEPDTDVGHPKESWVFQAVSPFTKEGLVHEPRPTECSNGYSATSDSVQVDVVDEDVEEPPPGPPPEVPRRASRGDKSAAATLAVTAVPAVLPARPGTASPAASSAPGSSASSVKMSAMEEESIRDRRRTALLRQCADILTADENLPRYTRDAFRRIFQEKDLLLLLFRLFDQDRDELLVQEDWIEFLKQRLTDERHIDFAEQVESVAYVLCGDGPLDPHRFCQLFQAKGIVDKLFRMVDTESSGSVTAEQILSLIANLTNARPRTGFDRSNLEWLERLFKETVGDQKEIRRDDFNKIVISKNPFFTERVFQIFDNDNSGSISLPEFLDAMHQFSGKSPDDKIKFLFKVYDIDGDGLIQQSELQHVMRACMEENGMQFSEEQVADLTTALFEDADPGGRGAITYEALKNQLGKHGGLLENLSISIDRWLVPPKPKRPPTSLWGKLSALRPYHLSRPYLKNNYVHLVFGLVLILVNLGLFVSRAFEYRHSHGFVILARACGQCLNFNCMLVLVLMLRHSITYLRTRGFSQFLPLDQHIYFHKVTGVLIFVYATVHTISHLLNFSLQVIHDPMVNSQNYTLYEWLLTSKPGVYGLVGGGANPTGVALGALLLVMFVCSQAFVRRGGCFEIFYWTHLLYVPFWGLLIFHGPNFWKWFLGPGVVFLIERLLRFTWMRTGRGKTYISSGLLLPSRVTHLVIKRPPHFDFHPGDYVFVNIPSIAVYEWHPFTISSAPEQEDYMWLHIRGVGEWTNQLYAYFEREQEKLHNVNVELPSASGAAAQPSSPSPQPTGLRRLQASLSRKWSSRDVNVGSPVAKKQVNFPTRGYRPGPDDPSFQSVQVVPPGEDRPHASPTQDGPLKPAALRRLVLDAKVPLSKALSMPDMDNRTKKRDRLLALRDFARSESEKSFDECQMRRARLQSLGLAYLSPQNKSLAQSFRYMRHKPTIIAFKTPSLESCQARLSALALAQAAARDSRPVRDASAAAEEGRAPTDPAADADADGKHTSPPTPIGMNYPVGKPLEVMLGERSLRSSDASINPPPGTTIYLDGPYGAPSSHIFRAQHAVLIATGIGVTPFASILQSIMHRYWKARHTCPQCSYAWASDIPATIMNLRKVDFFWINRDQRSFEWFVNLLSQLEIEQAELGGAMERFLEMHMYITSALQKADMKAVGLQLALDLLHEKEKRDLITGLKTRTNAGRPNWDKVFKQLVAQKKGKVTVFYCGPPQLARLLRVKCDQYGFAFRKEVF